MKDGLRPYLIADARILYFSETIRTIIVYSFPEFSLTEYIIKRREALFRNSSFFIFHFSFFIYITQRLSHFTFHISLFTFHFSHFTFHISLFTSHFSHLTFHISLFT